MKSSIVSKIRYGLILGAFASTAVAAPLTFDFKDPKGVNNAQFELDAPLEIISGYANGISGEVTFDPKHPEKTTGTIAIAADSLSVGNPMMQEHLQGKGWLDVATYPEINFKISSLEVESASDGKISGIVAGTLTLHGVSKDITAPVTLTYLPGKLGARINKPEVSGDLLVVRSDFTINRSDFGIKPGQATDKVDEIVQISLRIVGGHRG